MAVTLHSRAFTQVQEGQVRPAVALGLAVRDRGRRHTGRRPRAPRNGRGHLIGWILQPLADAFVAGLEALGWVGDTSVRGNDTGC